MYRLNLVPKTGTNAVTCSQHDTGLRMLCHAVRNISEGERDGKEHNAYGSQ